MRIPAALALVACVAIGLAGCTAPPSPSGDVIATVELAGLDAADSTQVTASGRVDGVAESGGTCTFTFYAEGGSASRLTAEGVAAGDHTECGPVGEAEGFLVDDRYEVELKYESETTETVRSERYPMELAR